MLLKCLTFTCIHSRCQADSFIQVKQILVDCNLESQLVISTHQKMLIKMQGFKNEISTESHRDGTEIILRNTYGNYIIILLGRLIVLTISHRWRGGDQQNLRLCQHTSVEYWQKIFKFRHCKYF